MIEVRELKGFASLRAMNACTTLLYGLTMLPSICKDEDFDVFCARMKNSDRETQMKMVRLAAQVVRLEQEELLALAGFCVDSNGVPYQAANIKNLSADQLVDIIVAVCMKFLEIKVDLITEAEKKN